MEKTISFETLGGIIEIQYRDTGEYFELEELSFSKDRIEDCSGIWKEESVFVTENGWRLRLSTEVLIDLINATRKIVNDKDTSWWSRDEDRHKQFKGLLK